MEADSKFSAPFTIHDILDRGYNLEPLKCIHCGHVGEVVFLQYIGDGACQMCGRWQLEEGEGDAV